MYNVGLPSNKTLYQLQGERIRRLERLALELTGKSAAIPWYIMTSEHTKEPTEEFFAKHGHFGLKKENVVLFEQNTLPCFTLDGKIILEKPWRVARAPDGNGGLYRALKHCGILEDMESRGIQYVHVYGVDNILVKMADPTFVGYCVKKGAQAGAKVVEKVLPTEAVGIICKVQGKYQVVEYSEVSMRVAEARNGDNRLTFRTGSICNHFFTLDFLKLVSTGKHLKHHVALKKIPFTSDEGTLVRPEKVNGIKLEKFVFDVFQFTSDFVVWEVLREDEFSPLKNADTAEKDTPTTARNSIYDLHRRYVLAAGGAFISGGSPVSAHKRSGDTPAKEISSDYESSFEEDTIICEISPLVSYDGEGLETFVSGLRFCSPLLLPNDGDLDMNRTQVGVKEVSGSQNRVQAVNG
jgi:UDP-N-acetylglucosamine/UDP-N-acetylgalactosamine diphosphorylase